MRILIIPFLIWLTPNLLAQSDQMIRRNISTPQSVINRQYDQHSKYYPKRERRNSDYDSYCKKVDSGIKKLIDGGQFFDDPKLSVYLNSVLSKLLDSSQLNTDHVHLLVDKNYMVNARVLGYCSMVIHNGLLSVVETEEELAFVMAHEIAHLELDHIYQKVIRLSESDLQDDARKLLFEEVESEDMMAFKDKVYRTADFNRQLEMDADSLALQIYFNAYGNTEAPLNALKILKPFGEHSSLKEQLFRPFNFKKNPFDFHLLREDISVFSKESNSVLFMSRDSLLSHPEMEERMANLSKVLSQRENQSSTSKPIFWLNKSSRYENIFYAMSRRLHTVALYEALRLKHDYPGEKEVNTYIARILHKLHDDKRDGLFDLYFSRYTRGYPEDLLLVHNFIRNITYGEAVGMAYNFLSLSRNFDANNADHYKLLVASCEKLGRAQQADMIRQAYAQQFNATLD